MSHKSLEHEGISSPLPKLVLQLQAYPINPVDIY